MKRSLFFIPLMILLASCSQFGDQRNYLSDLDGESGHFFEPEDDFPVVAGDSGRRWETDKERRHRIPKSPEDLALERREKSLARELASLEDRQTTRSLDLYERHKHFFKNNSEKIYFLKIPAHERVDYLSSRGFLSQDNRLSQSEGLRAPASVDSEVNIGMKKNEVLNSFGHPARVEVAGNPSNENERWAYQVNGATKYIYFESGEVQGWE